MAQNNSTQPEEKLICFNLHQPIMEKPKELPYVYILPKRKPVGLLARPIIVTTNKPHGSDKKTPKNMANEFDDMPTLSYIEDKDKHHE